MNGRWSRLILTLDRRHGVRTLDVVGVEGVRDEAIGAGDKRNVGGELARARSTGAELAAPSPHENAIAEQSHIAGARRLLLRLSPANSDRHPGIPHASRCRRQRDAWRTPVDGRDRTHRPGRSACKNFREEAGLKVFVEVQLTGCHTAVR